MRTRVALLGLLLCLVLVVAMVAACSPAGPAPAPSPTPKPTAAPSPASSPSPTAKPSPAKPAPITIGLNMDTSGFSRDAGTSQTEAAILIIEQWNARGGVRGGAEIKYVSRDNGGDPAKATTIAKEFVTMKLPVVLGGASSTVAIPESAVYTPAKIPSLLTAAAKAAFGQAPDGKVYAFSLPGTTELMAETALRDMSAKGYKKIAMLLSNVAFPKDLVAAAKDLVAKKYGQQNGMEIVTEVALDVNATDLSAEVVKLRQLKFDAIYSAMYPGNVQAYVRALADTKWRPAPFTYILWDLASTVWATGEKSLFSGFRGYAVANDSKESLVKAKGEYMIRWGHEPPSGNWTMAYDGMNLILKAIDAVGTDPGAIRDYLETKVKGVPIISGRRDAKADFTMETGHSLADVDHLYGFLNVNDKGQLVWE